MPTKADALACNGLLTLRQCTALLKPLHKMEAAFAFRMPVDPEALNLPDYHTVIKRPMDLGTIQEKLDKAKCARPQTRFSCRSCMYILDLASLATGMI